MVKKKNSTALDFVTSEISGNFEILEQKIEKLPTRDEFKGLSKELGELKNYVYNLPTKFDYNDLKKQVADLPTRDEFNGLKQQVAGLPTRDEFFKAMDKLMAEIKAERDENDDIDLRFKRIERHFPQVV